MSSTTSMTSDSLAKAYEDICSKFYIIENKKKCDDYVGVEKLYEEFMKLNLPKASDILNVAAGPGILSVLLQKQGYSTIDGMDPDPTTIKSLFKSGLYRNNICKQISGLNSTGLREDVYDAVVMVGGFCPVGGTVASATPAAAIAELFRIVKPDGHILFTMRADYHKKETDYGLLEDNLRDLEKEGKCFVLNKGERFTDRHSQLEGMFYLLQRRVAKDEFRPNNNLTPAIVVEDMGVENDVVNVCIASHVKLCQAFFKLRLPRNAEILDVSCYSEEPGRVGFELSHRGYHCVDGLNHKLSEFEIVKSQKIYRNYILGRVAELGSIPVNDESYDVLLMSCGFAPGQSTPSSFPELIRVLRPGGYLLWTMPDCIGSKDPEFALFDVKVQDLVVERKWDLLAGPLYFKMAPQGDHRFYLVRRYHREVFALGSARHSPGNSPVLNRRRRRSIKDC